MAFAVLIAYSTPTLRGRLAVLLAAVPLAIASNLARVLVLVLLSLWQGFGILDTFIHPLSGMLTFAVALPPILWLGSARRFGGRA